MLEILVVDDEADLRLGIVYELAEAGHHVTEACDGAEALRLIDQRSFDIVITDVRLPQLDGLALLEVLRRRAPDTAVILMTAYGRVADATAALHRGAYDYVTKPFDVAEFPLKLVERIAAERRVDAERQAARDALGDREADELVGRSPELARVRASLDKLARSDAAVLIQGESGTGKELVARALHRRSHRCKGPFVAVNCAALPEGLIEAELFGHERGAFTGAVRRRDGRFRAADGGTLLLDEVGEIPLAVQAKLLRVLQEGTIEPVGTESALPVDVRIVSATHRDLKAMVAQGLFREDLYYRLRVLDVELPPLRAHPADLPLLVEHFLGKMCADAAVPRFSAAAWGRLLRHSFPGNVRELMHILERAVVLATDGVIEVEHLPAEVGGASPATPTFEPRPLAVAMAEFERAYLVDVLRLTRGHRARAAQLLGVSRKTLWEKSRGYGIGDDELGSELEPDGEDGPERN